MKINDRRAILTNVLACFALTTLNCTDLSGQMSTLENGTLTISEGTRVTFMEPVVLAIGAGAGVLNNGLLELRDGQLTEPEGGPITGTGFETAFAVLTGGGFAAEPGGLGLHLSGTANADTLFIVRGHQPIVVNGTISSVARWFEVVPSANVSAAIIATMRIDLTELNGIAPDLLQLHRALTSEGPWVPLPSSADPGNLTVVAEMDITDRFVTAFSSDVMTGVADRSTSATCLVWPTLAQEFLHIRLSDGTLLRRIEVFDMAGNLVNLPGLSTGSSFTTIQVENLRPGMYTLQANGTHRSRFVRQ